MVIHESNLPDSLDCTWDHSITVIETVTAFTTSRAFEISGYKSRLHLSLTIYSMFSFTYRPYTRPTSISKIGPHINYFRTQVRTDIMKLFPGTSIFSHAYRLLLVFLVLVSVYVSHARGPLCIPHDLPG